MNQRAAAIVLLVVGALAYLLRPRTAAAQPVDTRRDTSSFGPLEQVGPIGNTTPPPPTTPVAGDPIALPTVGSGAGNFLCRCAPIGSFGAACLGGEWTAFVPGVFDPPPGFFVKRLTPAQISAAGLEPGHDWHGLDYRQKLAVDCQR